MKTLVAPSLLAADFSRLADEIRSAEAAGADYLHLDIMDGHFVPNLTFGPPVVEKLRGCTRLPFDVHLMIDRPDLYAPRFIAAGADIVTLHVESPCFHNGTARVADVLQDIAARGARPGLVLKPATPAGTLLPYLPQCAMVLIMTVEPGFGGQAFMPAMLPKIKAVRAAAPALDIEVDGGIDSATAPHCAASGANVFVAGTFLFGQRDIAARIAQLHNLHPSQ
jgi:ribulose-phosphate 3-epimerase